MAALSKAAPSFWIRLLTTGKGRALLAGILVLAIYAFKKKSGKRSSGEKTARGKKSKQGKGKVDKVFFERMKKLLKIVFPRFASG